MEIGSPRPDMKEAAVEADTEGAASVAEKTAEERKALLAQAVAREEKRGWRLESQEDFHAVMVRMKRSTYLFHLILTVLMSPQTQSAGGERREVITVDEYGKTEILR